MPLKKGTTLHESVCTKCIRDEREDFDSSYGKLYGFYVEFEDGSKGIYNAKDGNNPKIKIGEKASFYVDSITSDKNPDSEKLKIRYEKPFTPGNNSFKPMPPEQQKSIAMQVAYEVAIDFCVKTGTSDIKTVSNNIYGWIVAKGLTSDIQRRACGVSRLAVRAFDITTIRGDGSLNRLNIIMEDIFKKTDPEVFKDVH